MWEVNFTGRILDGIIEERITGETLDGSVLEGWNLGTWRVPDLILSCRRRRWESRGGRTQLRWDHDFFARSF